VEEFVMTQPISTNPVSLKVPPKQGGFQIQSALPAKAVGLNQPLLMNRKNGPPVAPAAFHKPDGPKVLQAKLRNAPFAMHSRTMAGVSSGVVQANVVGGNHALQARLNLWNTRLTRGASMTIGQAGNPNSARAVGPANGPRAIQRKTGPGVEAFRVPLRQKSGGLPLPAEVRAKMETAFSADFSEVRVHIGQEASSLGAIAYTWGTNIHFAPGQYNPHTLQGQKLLGHELWHVVQQRSGRVSNPFGGGVAVVQDHALEAEADRMGIKAALTQIARKKAE
jgi:hypothetical protein